MEITIEILRVLLHLGIMHAIIGFMVWIYGKKGPVLWKIMLTWGVILILPSDASLSKRIRIWMRRRREEPCHL